MIKTPLLSHQKETLSFALKKKYYFDLSVPGTGKTLSSLAVVDSIKKKTFVATPPHLVNTWLHEVGKHTDLKATPHFLKFDPSFDVYIVPYTKLRDSEETFKNCDFVIAEEGHYLKNLDSQRTKYFHTLMSKHPPEYFAFLSGTPLKNRVTEIYSPLILLGLSPDVQPKILDKYRSFYVFCNRFTNVKNTPFGASYSGSKNVDELRSYIVPFAIKHKEDVLNLPELSESKVVVSYKDDPELEKAFNEFTGASVGVNITAKAKSAESKSVFTANYVLGLLDQDCGPIVIFSDHRKSIATMELELSNKRVRSITGETSMGHRSDYVNMLNNGQLDVLIASIGSSSSGITLTGSSVLVFNDLCWTPGDVAQAKKRIHRLSQTKPCRIIYVVGSTTDEKIINMLNNKSRTIEKVLKGI